MSFLLHPVYKIVLVRFVTGGVGVLKPDKTINKIQNSRHCPRRNIRLTAIKYHQTETRIPFVTQISMPIETVPFCSNESSSSEVPLLPSTGIGGKFTLKHLRNVDCEPIDISRQQISFYPRECICSRAVY